MNKLFLLTLTGLLGSTLVCKATTVGFGLSPADRIVIDSNSAEISTSSLVWEGTFNNASNPAFQFNSSLSISANVTNMEAAGGWQQFGTTNLGINSVFGHVRISGSVQDNTSAADAFNGKNVYLWVFNASTVAAATQMGIYTDTGIWVFPVNGGVTDSVNYDTTTTYTPTAVAGAGNVNASNIVLSASSAVPEPSTLVTLAGATGVLGMLRRRRQARA